MTKVTATTCRGVMVAVAIALAGCSSVNRMSLPQKVDVGTTAYCQSMSQASSYDPGVSSLTAMEQYIVTPASGHNGMGLPIEGTRLEADVQAARQYNGNESIKFLTAVKNVIADCQYILARSQ